MVVAEFRLLLPEMKNNNNQINGISIVTVRRKKMRSKKQEREKETRE